MLNNKQLQASPLFGGLLDSQLDTIRPLMNEERFKPGDLIIEEGKRGNRLFFLAEGEVEILKKTWDGQDHKPRRLAVLKAGDTFGEMEILDVEERSATVRATQSVTAYSLSGKDLHQIYQANIETFTMMVMNLARELSRRLRRMDQLVGSSLCAGSFEEA